MKRLIAIMLAAFILTGCGGKQPVETTAATTPETTAPQTFYDPDSEVQAQTSGAVRAYPLLEADYGAIAPMGDKLLLVGSSGKVVALEGEEGTLAASIQTDAQLLSDTAFSVSDSGMSYYRTALNQVVLLDKRLVEYARVELPEDISGNPAVSFDTGEVYYCQAQQVRALDMENGVSRLVLSHRYKQAELIGCYLGGTVLALKTVDTDNNEGVLYLESATGQIEYETKQVLTFYSYGSSYLTESMDGDIRQYVFGTVETESICLDSENRIYSALRQHGAVGCNTDDGHAVLDFYDLQTGLRTSGVTIPDVSRVVDIDSDGRYVWILAEHANQLTLYRWDTVQTPTADEQVYTKALYTAQQPDEEGLEVCRQQAQALNDRYGINVRIWSDAVSVPGNYELTAEHQPETISQMLDVLETVLSQYPESFLSRTIGGGKLQISLVRSIAQEQTYDWYYADGNAFIVLCPQSNMNRDFLRALSYIVDSHVLGNSRDYDNWAQLNPEGFDYAYTYDWTPDETVASYLEDGSRYFIDEASMTYPNEDRSSIFVYAMLPEGETCFAESQMQKKLCRLCEGIREAYGLEELEETLPWEQYLILEMDYSNK